MREANRNVLRHWWLCALLTGVLGACASVEGFDEPDVELVGLEPLAGSPMEARFLVRLRIVNPNSIDLEIDGMAYEVDLRDRKLLSGVSNKPLTVGAYSETTAELEVAVGMFGSLSLLRDLLTDPPEAGLPYALRAKLSRKGFGGTIRVNREGILDFGSLSRGLRVPERHPGALRVPGHET